MKRLILAATVALGLAQGALAQESPTKITLGYTLVIDYLGAFVAEDQGYFDKRKLDVDILQMPNGNSIPPGLLSESLQIGGITAPTLIQSKTASFPMKIVSGASMVTKANPNGSIVVRKGVDIKAPKDFVGKRVAVAAVGSYFNVLFRQWLINNGVDPHQVVFVEAPFGQMADVMRNEQVDAATVGQPFLGRMVAADIGADFAAYTGSFGDGLLSNIYVATDQWVEANSEAATAFVEAIEEAGAFIKSNPDEARKSAAKYLKLPPEALANLPLSNYSAKVTADQIDTWSEIMLGQKLITQKIDANSVLLD